MAVKVRGGNETFFANCIYLLVRTKYIYSELQRVLCCTGTSIVEVNAGKGGEILVYIQLTSVQKLLEGDG